MTQTETMTFKMPLALLDRLKSMDQLVILQNFPDPMAVASMLQNYVILDNDYTLAIPDITELLESYRDEKMVDVCIDAEPLVKLEWDRQLIVTQLLPWELMCLLTECLKLSFSSNTKIHAIYLMSAQDHFKIRAIKTGIEERDKKLPLSGDGTRQRRARVPKFVDLQS